MINTDKLVKSFISRWRQNGEYNMLYYLTDKFDTIADKFYHLPIFFLLQITVRRKWHLSKKKTRQIGEGQKSALSSNCPQSSRCLCVKSRGSEKYQNTKKYFQMSLRSYKNCFKNQDKSIKIKYFVLPWKMWPCHFKSNWY